MKTFIFVCIISLSLYAHPGRLDSHGGHTDKSTGLYHYHTHKKGTNIKPHYAPIRIQILKYGQPYSWGQKFASIERCEARRKMLQRQNMGSDYTYVCAVK
jgi:hypothetical protein